MRLRRLLPIVAVFVVLAAGCDWPNVTPPGTAPVRYRDPIFNAVTVTSNVTYGSAVNRSARRSRCKLDVYEPTGDTVTSRPAIVWVHGGSFCCGNKTSAELVDEANDVRQEGLRERLDQLPARVAGLLGNASPNCVIAIQEAAADAQTAVRFLRTNAATYGIDPNRIAIGGSSAGAITALNVGLRIVRGPTARVRAAVSLSGAQRRVGTISPGDAPALDFHGTTDPLVPYQWAVNTINAAHAQGLDAFLESFDGTATCRTPRTVNRSSIRRGTSCGGRWTSPTRQPEAADRWSGPIRRALRSRRFAADRHVSFGPAPGGIGTWHSRN